MIKLELTINHASDLLVKQMKMNDESDKENSKHYSIFSRNEQSKIDLSIETLQDHNADLKVEH